MEAMKAKGLAAAALALVLGVAAEGWAGGGKVLFRSPGPGNRFLSTPPGSAGGAVRFGDRGFASFERHDFHAPVIVVGRGGFKHFHGPVVVTRGGFRRHFFHGPIVVLPGHTIVVTPRRHFFFHRFPDGVIVSEPFFCLFHDVGFVSRVGLVDHLIGSHRLPAEAADAACPESEAACLIDAD
jgi:hypothetical protein